MRAMRTFILQLDISYESGARVLFYSPIKFSIKLLLKFLFERCPLPNFFVGFNTYLLVFAAINVSFQI
jgi:hypothetical protein